MRSEVLLEPLKAIILERIKGVFSSVKGDNTEKEEG